MSTPAFLPQDSSSQTAIRYYTATDPYHYSVDNRPLVDIASNLSLISSGGGDSARRAVLLSQLSASAVLNDLYPNAISGTVVTGLPVSLPVSYTVRVGQGALYQAGVINASNPTTIVKQALYLTTNDFAVPAPLTAGQSIAYLIQAQYTDLSTANMPTSALPYLDQNNSFLPCLLLNGELKLSLKTGSAAATGSQVTPSADAGWIPLYVVVSTYGSVNPVVSASPLGPTFKGINTLLGQTVLSSGGTTTTTVAGVPVQSFADGSTQGLALNFPIKDSKLNPFVPVKLKLTISGDTTGNAFAMRVRYLALGTGDAVTGSFTVGNIENITYTAGVNNVQTYSTSTSAIVPSTAFSGFVNNVWSVNKEKLYLILERVGGDPSDTNTGNLRLLDAVAFQ